MLDRHRACHCPSDGRAEVRDDLSRLADEASALGLVPAACAVLRDQAAPQVLRDRARFVVERALRSVHRQ